MKNPNLRVGHLFKKKNSFQTTETRVRVNWFGASKRGHGFHKLVVIELPVPVLIGHLHEVLQLVGGQRHAQGRRHLPDLSRLNEPRLVLVKEHKGLA